MSEDQKKLRDAEEKNRKLEKELRKAIKEKNEAVSTKTELSKKVTELENQLKAQTTSMRNMDKISKENEHCRQLMIAELNRTKDIRYELSDTEENEEEEDCEGEDSSPLPPIFDVPSSSRHRKTDTLPLPSSSSRAARTPIDEEELPPIFD